MMADVRPMIESASLDMDASGPAALQFRLRSDASQASARPREIVALLVGEGVPDYRLTRVGLLSRGPAGLVPLQDRGPAFRAKERRTGDVGAIRSAAAHGA